MVSDNFCRVCSELLTEDNWNISRKTRKDYICKECANTKSKTRWHSLDPELKTSKRKEWAIRNKDFIKEKYNF